MKAITLTQPWATLVAIGDKQWETRSWATDYRGELAIHAAKGFPRWARDLCHMEPFHTALHHAGYCSDADELPIGEVVAIAELVECRSTTTDLIDGDWTLRLTDREHAFGDFSPGRYGWRLANVRELPRPVPARGSLGLWEWRQ